MRKIYFATVISVFICFSLFFSTGMNAQGCVAVRPMSCSGVGYANGSALLPKGHFQLSTTYRYFKSYKHFRGDVEEEERVEDGTEVINTAHSMDIGMTYAITDRFNISQNIPLIYFDRSSLYEHYGNATSTNPDQKRFHTGAAGVGDIRFTASYWLIKPGKDSSGNISIGGGIKLPTGNSYVTDEFHRRTADGRDSTILKPVDQSIQLGDGGWGFVIETQGFCKFGERLAGYYNGFYMFNPQNVNKTPNRSPLATTGDNMITNYHSIADQYMFRFGMNFQVMKDKGLYVSLGGRAEGIPAKDRIGKSDGFRRPGYIISVEPGLNFQKGNHTFVLNIPVALYRNRVKNTYDLADPDGLRHGDAAFADYLINFTYLYKFGKSHHDM
ncbi:hypothetical protein BH11BAC7_BH11BAC7_02140 [soil metagenome]